MTIATARPGRVTQEGGLLNPQEEGALKCLPKQKDKVSNVTRLKGRHSQAAVRLSFLITSSGEQACVLWACWRYINNNNKSSRVLGARHCSKHPGHLSLSRGLFTVYANVGICFYANNTEVWKVSRESLPPPSLSPVWPCRGRHCFQFCVFFPTFVCISSMLHTHTHSSFCFCENTVRP